MEPFTFFVSYRRQDTAPIALLLKYEIEKRLQFVRVFVDVDDVQLGDVFPDRIRRTIDRTHATIVLIGKNWMPRRDAPADRGAPARSRDWVVEEIEYSRSAPMNEEGRVRYGMERRAILPIFIDMPRRFDLFELRPEIADIALINAENVDYANWPTAIGPMIERLAVKLKLPKRPDSDKYPKADPVKARTQPLPEDALAAILRYDDYEGWYVDNFGHPDERYLAKTFEFSHFNQASDFMKLVSDYCRVLDHHPEWRNLFTHVTVSLTTWDARRHVTIYDLNLALFMNKAAKAVREPQKP